MDEFGLRVDPEAKIWQLSVGEQQRVEILARPRPGRPDPDPRRADRRAHDGRGRRAVRRDAVARRQPGAPSCSSRTSSTRCSRSGDRITVLRNGAAGRHVSTPPARPPQELARLMTGEERELSVEHRDTSANPPVLELRGVSARSSRGLPALARRDLVVRAGEILGIAGVSGNGQSELAEVLTGLRRVDAGEVLVVRDDGSPTPGHARFAAAGRRQHPRGPHRDGAGALGARPRQRDPAPLPQPRAVGTGHAATRGRRASSPGGWSTGRGADPLAAGVTGILSGGNQQRLIVHREALVATSAFVAMHPSRGLDVGAAQDVQAALLAAREPAARSCSSPTTSTRCC